MQITFDCLDTDTGELQRGRIAPAGSGVSGRLAGPPGGRPRGVHLAFGGCTGWRYVAEELARAGVAAQGMFTALEDHLNRLWRELVAAAAT
jgi:hypothetical protein